MVVPVWLQRKEKIAGLGKKYLGEKDTTIRLSCEISAEKQL
jgi:hypothetical protein